MNGEVPKSAVIRKSITNPETGGSLDVVYKKDTAFRALGHILAIPSHLMFGRLQDVGVDPDPKLVDEILLHWSDVPWKGDVTVRIGHIDPKSDWKRIVEQKRREGKSNVFTETAGLLTTYIVDWKHSLTRSNFYNSWTKTVHMYHPDSAVASHELGHAQDLENPGKKTKFFKGLRNEWMASKHAMEHAGSDEKRRNAMKILEPAFGTYIANMASNTVLLGGLVGLFASEFHTPKPMSFYEKKAPVFLGAFVASKFMPIALAHLLSRLPHRKSTFGYVFEGKTVQEPLKPHQVYTATAGAK